MFEHAHMPRYTRLKDCPEGLRKLLQEQFGNDAMDSPGRPGKRTKYGNVRTEFNGEVFDSKAEAQDDQTFRMQEAAGEIAGYARQVSIPLRAKGGRRMRLDFMVNRKRQHSCSRCGNVDQVNGLVLMDRKGVVTPEWETKRRILEAQLGIEIEILRD
jgi:hypothetical protein